MDEDNVEIKVYPLTDDDVPTYKVKVKSADEITTHIVVMDEHYFDRISDGMLTRESFITFAFRFLLEKEENTCILSEFEISDIARYYPQFEEEIQERIRHARRRM